MHKSPVISVIVPCYNQGQYLAEALDSILQQTYTNWECIIVNDGSDDNTDVIAKDYLKRDSRFKYIFQENKGLSAARNTGVKNTSGEYILPLDADDKIVKTYLEKIVAGFKSHPETRLIYCQAEKFGAAGGKWQLKEYNFETLLKGNIIFCTAAYRRADYIKTEGYDESMKNGYEDWEFWIQLLKPTDKVIQIDEVLFFYRIKPVSSIYTDVFFEEKKRKYIFKKHLNVYLDNLPDPILLAQQNDMLRSVYQSSFDYRLGHMLLAPVRKILNFFR